MPDESPILTGAPEAAPAPSPQTPQVAEIGLTPPPPPGPDIIDYAVGGKTYRVERGFIDMLNQSLQPQAAPAPAAPAPEDDISTIWYTDPKRAAEMVRKQAVEEVSSLYRQEQFWTGFWRDFDSQNPDLVPARGFAQNLLNNQLMHQQDFSSLSPAEGLKRLAVVTREQLMAATTNLRANVPAPLPALAEGASQTTRDVTNFTDAAGGRKIESLSEAIRARRESRRAANTKPASE